MLKNARVVVIALLLVLVMAGCSKGTLTKEDVDATMARLDSTLLTAPADNPRSALVGTVITEDFSWEGGDEDIPASTEDLALVMRLDLLTTLVQYAEEGMGGSFDIKGDSLVMKGTDDTVTIEFIESGDIFLIRKVTSK